MPDNDNEFLNTSTGQLSKAPDYSEFVLHIAYENKPVFWITPELELVFGEDVTPKEAAHAIHAAWKELLREELSKLIKKQKEEFVTAGFAPEPGETIDYDV